jgi:hypothetical protein
MSLKSRNKDALLRHKNEATAPKPRLPCHEMDEDEIQKLKREIEALRAQVFLAYKE